MAPFFRVPLGPSRSNSYIGTFYLSLSLITILGDNAKNSTNPKNHSLIDPFPCLHLAGIHYACAWYWQAETKQTFFLAAFFISDGVSDNIHFKFK